MLRFSIAANGINLKSVQDPRFLVKLISFPSANPLHEPQNKKPAVDTAGLSSRYYMRYM